MNNYGTDRHVTYVMCLLCIILYCIVLYYITHTPRVVSNPFCVFLFAFFLWLYRTVLYFTVLYFKPALTLNSCLILFCFCFSFFLSFYIHSSFTDTRKIRIGERWRLPLLPRIRINHVVDIIIFSARPPRCR